MSVGVRCLIGEAEEMLGKPALVISDLWGDDASIGVEVAVIGKR